MELQQLRGGMTHRKRSIYIYICWISVWVRIRGSLLLEYNPLLILITFFHWATLYLSSWSVFNIALYLLFFSSLGPHLWHMEVPGLGVESELQLLAYTTVTAMEDPSHSCNLHHSSWQHRILNTLSEARDRTCNLMVLVKFISAAPRRELHTLFSLILAFLQVGQGLPLRTIPN